MGLNFETNIKNILNLLKNKYNKTFWILFSECPENVETDALAASVIRRMNHYLKSVAVARVKELELKGPRIRSAPPFRASAPRMPARKG
ncbi:unnamed protein product [Parnassius mnemosyne]|uniref:Uncharacterized protein n=1 Tax=Parnassius mnemosyne TaxID=213953 RepID=A0AAV1KDI3_9NEOP